MEKSNYQFWLDYHSGLIKRKLSEDEYKEIVANEFAMHFLIPTKQLLKLCGGYKGLYSIDGAREKELASLFEVPLEVMKIKINYLKESKSKVIKGAKKESYQSNGILEVPNFNILKANNVGSNNKITKSNKPTETSKLDIANVYNSMLEEVVGQDEIIQTILMTIDENIYANAYSNSSENRKHVLIVGPTGSGKTRMMKALQSHINYPIVRIDTTQITMHGYHGGKIEQNILEPLLVKAGGNLELAQNGIVNLDEIDKKGSENNSDVAGRGMLNEFLPFLDGTIYDVEYNYNHIKFDTSKLTVLASGAFTDTLYSIDRNPTGFISINKNEELSKEILNKKGNIPMEFLRRFPNLVQMRQLIDNDLKEILIKPKISPIIFEYNYLQERHNVLLKCEEDYFDELIKRALALKTGGSALKDIIVQSLRFAKW